MDAEALRFRAGIFDAVLCASALYLLPQPVEALRGFRRVLRPGGTLAVAVFGPDLD
jgi:ubiquinone/menaquinone biosynthesis C-methylase UbiE